MVNLNDEIKKGQVISGIGKTSTFEYHEPEHLHFEMYKDEICENPLTHFTVIPIEPTTRYED